MYKCRLYRYNKVVNHRVLHKLERMFLKQYLVIFDCYIFIVIRLKVKLKVYIKRLIKRQKSNEDYTVVACYTNTIDYNTRNTSCLFLIERIILTLKSSPTSTDGMTYYVLCHVIWVLPLSYTE